jgi:hypothetical protein
MFDINGDELHGQTQHDEVENWNTMGLVLNDIVATKVNQPVSEAGRCLGGNGVQIDM